MAQPQTTVQPSQGTAARALRLLVVDDDALGRSMMELMLASQGYQLDFACDGAEALQAVRTAEYDLVFMDLVLPDIDGREVCREIRRGEAGKRHLPIIAVTAFDLPGQPLELVKAGMDDYLFKPYDQRSLTRMIRLYASGESDELAGVDTQRALSDMSQTPVLDTAGSLLDFANDVAGYKELLGDFVESLPVRLDHLLKAQQAGDRELLGRECHSLKGISAGLGAMRLSRLSAHLSNTLKHGQDGSIPAILTEIERGIQEVSREAQAFLSS